ncbi:MAG: hypothetical protein WC091_02615 [Sulfuricellaceae bacterium]
MAKKRYDLAVKVGSYTSNGKEKNRYQNIGVVMEKDDGGTFILLERSFNPAGVPFKEGGNTVMVSMFEPKGDKDEQPEPKQEAPKAGGGLNEEIDQIPFAPFEGSL